MRPRVELRVVLLPLVLGVVGCSLFGRAIDPLPATVRSTDRTPEPSTVRTTGLSDANIAAILLAANDAEILYADQALAKSSDRDVLAFALMTKKDHEAVNAAVHALVTRIDATPVDNELSFDLRDDAEAKRALFRELDRPAFDSAYAANEVAYHRAILRTIDDLLIPQAKDPEMKVLLLRIQVAVRAHLEHAGVLAVPRS